MDNDVLSVYRRGMPGDGYPGACISCGLMRN